MGPKKAKAEPPVIEGYNQESMTREQVEVLCYRLQEGMKKEREDRAFFQLERDKVRAFWEVARRQLEEVILEVRNKEHGREEGEAERQRVLKFHDSNVKFLKSEFEKNVNYLKKERDDMLQKAKDEFHTQTTRIRQLRRNTQDELRSQQEKQQVQEDSLKEEHKLIVENLAEENKEELEELSDNFEKHLVDLRGTLTLKHRVEMAETEERQKLQIDILLKNHAVAMNDLKEYYNEITLNNLSLISSLKASCAEAQEGRVRNMQESRTLRAENKKLAGPLAEVREQVADMQRRMTNYHKDKKALQRASTRALAAERAADDLRYHSHLLQIKIDDIRDERENIMAKLRDVERELKSSRRLSVDRRVQELQKALQQREAEATSLVKLPQIICSRVQAVQPMLHDRNRRLARLALERTRLRVAHDSAIRQLSDYLPRDAPGLIKNNARAGPSAENATVRDFKIANKGESGRCKNPKDGKDRRVSF